MSKWIVLAGVCLCLGVGLGACGGSDKFDEVLAEQAKFRDEMCNCTTPTCANGVWQRWTAYRMTMRETLGKDARPNDVQQAKGRAILEEMNACREKVDPRRPAGAGSAEAGSAAAGSAAAGSAAAGSAGSVGSGGAGSATP